MTYEIKCFFLPLRALRQLFLKYGLKTFKGFLFMLLKLEGAHKYQRKFWFFLLIQEIWVGPKVLHFSAPQCDANAAGPLATLVTSSPSCTLSSQLYSLFWPWLSVLHLSFSAVSGTCSEPWTVCDRGTAQGTCPSPHSLSAAWEYPLLQLLCALASLPERFCRSLVI